MLNGDTKRKIQGARDILVGKIPVPTAQVEQITLALMYKFMSDMDEQAKKLGDKTGFFMDEFEKYSWKNITDTSLSAYDRVALYSEGLEKMNNNPNVPQLFRDIFKGAFLPFKDPETLKLFLDQINEIEYTHSEDLGDAYEYLLSVMGSQGDAGQFRTPRHIIDFIVQVVDPKKEDRILDPACGTAGFLISAYKHILKQNTSKDSKVLGDNLSPMDRRNLTKNFVGYDISHEMRRLSLVNMYLHQFSDPQIYEYDTLTSLDNWDEDFDCILANPPFMTPRGGIRPHNRFAVQANKSEVLFVDYIMEHLSTTGKAGIIVPEGIIFISSNAYKNLRKLLVDDDYLWAVVSLPSGVFQPYSGVKTNVLLLDKSIAKRKESILFLDINDIGYSLGATKAQIKENDLPTAIEILARYKNTDGNEVVDHKIAWSICKSLIKDNGYNLTGKIYKNISDKKTTVDFKEVLLKDVVDIYKGKSSSTKTVPGNYKLYLTAENSKTSSKYDFEGNGIAIPLISSLGHGKAAIKRIHRVSGRFALANLLAYLEPKDGRLDPDYLYHIANSQKDNIAKLMQGAANVSMNIRDLELFTIPFPPIEEQKRIVEELDRYQRIIDGARMVIDNWKPEIEIDEEWEMVRLGSICKTSSGGTPLKSVKEYYEGGKIPWLRSGEISQGLIKKSELFITNEGLKNSSAKLFPIDTVLVAMYGATAGEVGLLKFESSVNQAICGIYPTENYIPDFLFLVLSSLKEDMKKLSVGGAQPNISQEIIKNLLIPLVDLDVQKELVKNFYKEIEVIEANQQLLIITESKIRDKIKSLFK